MTDRTESIIPDLFDTTLDMTITEISTPTPTPSFGTISGTSLVSKSEILYMKCQNGTCPLTPHPTPRPAESLRSLQTPRPLPNYLREIISSPFSRPGTPVPHERIISPYELMKNNGESRSIWVILINIGINNIVFDVSTNRDFYGPGKVFNLFSGKDTIAHANVNLFDLSHDLATQLTFESTELNAEQNRKLTTTCLDIYNRKYPIVGRTKQD